MYRVSLKNIEGLSFIPRQCTPYNIVMSTVLTIIIANAYHYMQYNCNSFCYTSLHIPLLQKEDQKTASHNHSNGLRVRQKCLLVTH